MQGNIKNQKTHFIWTQKNPTKKETCEKSKTYSTTDIKNFWGNFFWNIKLIFKEVCSVNWYLKKSFC